ncbi:MAG: hypothetical protein PHC63_05360 [Candidatus Bathyarchaeota archaeon]|nr:hypothetical protein [Candidatus Bathyarchaeota archaeon]MDI9578781.1 hypothetical protein [Thermoproteota archaeon]
MFNGDRVFLTSPLAFEEYLTWCTKNHAPAWMSVQPFSGRNSVYCVEKLFFDFDSKDLNLAWKEANNLATMLQNSYGVQPLVCFSGSKGYHVYVWLSEIEQFDSVENAKRFYQTSQELLLKGLSFKTLDKQVLGDIKRLARIPYSVHEKSLKTCTPITMDRTELFIDDLKNYRNHGLSESFCNLCKSKNKQKTHRLANRFIPQSHKDTRPCINAALTTDLCGIAGHSMRIAVATEFLNRGFSPEQTAELFKSQSDYNIKKSLYYVRDILTRSYRPFKCSTIRKLGFCLQNCPRRPIET